MRLPRVVLKICLTIALGLTIVESTRAGGTNDARFTGLRLYEAGQFQEAIPYFDQVLASHTRDLEILIKRGSCYLRLDQPLKALDDFDRVNQHSGWTSRVFGPPPILDPNNVWSFAPLPDFTFAESWGHRGVALLMLGRNEEALESFRTSTYLWSQAGNQPRNVSPRNGDKLLRGKAGSYEGFGQAYFRLGQNEQAFQAYSQAIAIDPTDANGFAGRADVLANIKLLDSADNDYSEAIRLDPKHSRALCGRGIVRSDQGHDELAVADFNRAIELDAKYARAYSYRSVIYARRGQNDKALADCDALIRLLPDSPGPYKDRGAILVRMKRFDRAIEDLNEAIRLQANIVLPEPRGRLQRPGSVRTRHRRPVPGDRAQPRKCRCVHQPWARPFRRRAVRPGRRRPEPGDPARPQERGALLQPRRGVRAARAA
jgi:tetratricopeptide (TPR) repeat protein